VSTKKILTFVNKNIKIENMKKEEFTKYSDMYIKIKHKMDNIQMSLRYGLSNNDKAFLEMVSDLLKEE
jgi:hypothetical protein